MKLRTALIGAATAALVAIPAIAQAAWGVTTGSVNMRTGPSTGYAKVTTLPAGARIFVGGNVGGWYQVTYNGVNGFVSSNYVSTNAGPRMQNPGPQYGNQFPPRGPQYGNPYQGPRFGNNRGPRWSQNRPPAPRSGYYRNPTWDARNGAWYDGRRWYHNGVWYNSPNGFSFGFSFGG